MFGGIFKRKKPSEAPEQKWQEKVAWLPVGDEENPFSIEVLDCRAAAQSFCSTRSDRKLAETFIQLRGSSGLELIGRTPDEAVYADCDLHFPYKGQHSDGPIFLAKEMEDKWDFFAYGKCLYVRRSWTGALTHVAWVEYTPSAVVVQRVQCERNTAFRDPAFAVAQLHFLISTHLSRTLQPFPIPMDFPKEAGKGIALMGFNSYGRRAQFGAYLDQLQKLNAAGRRV